MSLPSSSPPRLPDRLVGVSLKMYFDLPQTLAYLTAVEEAKFSVREDSASSPTATVSSSAAAGGTGAGAEARGESKTALFIVPTTAVLAHPTIQSLIHPNPNPNPSHSPLVPRPEIILGAQNVHPADKGAYTGETSPLLLRQLGVRIVEIGHAERRGPPFAEDERFVAEKVQGVVRNGMVPLVCVGEKEKPKGMMDGEVGVQEAVAECKQQVISALTAVVEEVERTHQQVDDGGDNKTSATERSPSPYPEVVFAYEPVWAIGAREPASAEHVCSVVAALRRTVADSEMVPDFHGGHGCVKFLYGGSAGPGTWANLKRECDGLFLGRFAHDVKNLVEVWGEVDGE